MSSSSSLRNLRPATVQAQDQSEQVTADDLDAFESDTGGEENFNPSDFPESVASLDKRNAATIIAASKKKSKKRGEEIGRAARTLSALKETEYPTQHAWGGNVTSKIHDLDKPGKSQQICLTDSGSLYALLNSTKQWPSVAKSESAWNSTMQSDLIEDLRRPMGRMKDCKYPGEIVEGASQALTSNASTSPGWTNESMTGAGTIATAALVASAVQWFSGRG